MVKQAQYTYRGMNQDATKSKHPFELYYEGKNIRIIATDSQSTGSLSNELGNELALTLPDITISQVDTRIYYGAISLAYTAGNEIDTQINSGVLPTFSDSQTIIGHVSNDKSVILFTTDNAGVDCIWLVHDVLVSDFTLELLYIRNLGFSTSNLIQAIYNNENSIIRKVYWVDGINQLRFINISHSIQNGDLEELIDLDSSSINVSGQYDLSQPQIADISAGGSHTAGMVQYAYNLYKLNGAETTISPLSELVPLDSSNGGGALEEIVDAVPVVEAYDLDERYSHIKLYAIKYTSYNELPTVYLVVDEEIASYTKFSHFDDGIYLSEIALASFLFLGSNVLVPKHIETKDNRMFAANITDKAFNFEIDARAYSHDNGGTPTAVVWDDVTIDVNATFPTPLPGAITTVNGTFDNVDSTFDSVNPDYNTYKFQSDGATLGGEGQFIKYEIVQKAQTALIEPDLKLNRFFKDREIYRIAIQFYNRLGQISQPFWIADIKAPIGNLQDSLNTLSVTIKKTEYDAYITSLQLDEDETPVGYKIIRADRGISDKTIMCQGALTSMMVQTTRHATSEYYENGANNGFFRKQEESKEKPKLPVIFTRGGRNVYQGVVHPLDHLRSMSADPTAPYGGGDDTEIFNESSGSSTYSKQNTWQYTQMMQMYSPELLFHHNVSMLPSLRMKPIGVAPKIATHAWHYRINLESLNRGQEDKSEAHTDFKRGDGIIDMYGLFGPSRDEDHAGPQHMSFKQYYHHYDEIIPTSYSDDLPIYGKPEITEKGQGITDYNNDSELSYLNSLEVFLTDGKKWGDGNPQKDEIPITGINTYGQICATVVLGDDDAENDDRPTLEDLWGLVSLPSTDATDKGIMIGEFAQPSYYPYVGNIYGGNSYENKTRSSYIEIGQYTELDAAVPASYSIQIDSPGDTYVQQFKVIRLVKTDTEVIAGDKMQVTEILHFPVETSVNLINRNDKSFQPWDSLSQPRDDEYHEYNEVYSQQPTLVQNQAESFKLKRVTRFDTRIIASKTKIPGESIDSWTDYLDNEIMDLDGKYGGINGLVNFNDNIYSLQDEGLAVIGINPRVQVQGSDGVALELGTGSVLYDYNYITTKSGSINKWSIISSNSGIYYYDALNKSWNRFSQQLEKLTDIHGFHAFFNNNSDYSQLIVDNPLVTGVSTGYNKINHDIYLTLHQGNDSFTICFNELTNSFVSFYDYMPAFYINKGYQMITSDPTNTQLWEHFKGNYNNFYGTTYDSSITHMVNPQERDCIFNNIEFKSEAYINGVEQPKATFSHIKAWNEYQATAETPLILNKNMNRKFRMWRANIPRALDNGNPSLDRMRGHWIFLQLLLKNNNNRKLIVHDTNISYTPYN